MPRNASKQLPLKMVTAARVFPPACFEQAVNTIRHRLWRIRRLSAKFPILSASFYFGFTLNFNDWLHWSPMWILYIVSLFLSTFSTDRYLTNSIHSTTFTVRISISTNSRRTFVSDCRLVHRSVAGHTLLNETVWTSLFVGIPLDENSEVQNYPEALDETLKLSKSSLKLN